MTSNRVGRTAGRILLVALVVGGVMAAGQPAAAQSASFDCSAAKAPVEKLICGDPVLVQLDGALGAAFAARRKAASGREAAALLADQRAWLKERVSACGLSAKAEDAAAVDCLVAQYRSRLSALGASQPAGTTPGEALPAGVVHPLCVASTLAVALAEGDPPPPPPPLPIAACNRRMAHIPVSRTTPPGYLEADTADMGDIGYFAYKDIGPLPSGGQAILVINNPGGTLTVSGVAALTRSVDKAGGETLTGRMLFSGGDRCSGGIHDATLQGTKLDVAQNIDAPTFLEMATGSAEKTEGLPGGATDCLGTVTLAMPAGGGDHGQLLFATIDQDGLAELDQAGGSRPKCLAGLLRQGVGSFPHQYPPAEMQAITRAYEQQCR